MTKKIKFRELEAQGKIFIVEPEDGWSTRSFGNMEALRDSVVIPVKVPMRYGRSRAQLKMWVIIGSEAVILAGPNKWLRDGVWWFCFSDYEICGALIPQIELHWTGEGKYDPNILDVMLPTIPRISSVPVTSLADIEDENSWGPIAPELNLI